MAEDVSSKERTKLSLRSVIPLERLFWVGGTLVVTALVIFILLTGSDPLPSIRTTAAVLVGVGLLFMLVGHIVSMVASNQQQ